MENNSLHWNKEDLKAYLLIHGANANFKESSNEIALITSKISPECYAKIHNEWQADNDIESLHKLESAMARLGYTSEEKNFLFEELKQTLSADGSFDILERNLFRGLEHLLK